VREMGIEPWVTITLMKSRQDRHRLAEEVLEFGIRLARKLQPRN